MQSWHWICLQSAKICCQQKFVIDFIHFELIIKIAEFLIFYKSPFLLLQIAQFDKSITLFCFLFGALEFTFAVHFVKLKSCILKLYCIENVYISQASGFFYFFFHFWIFSEHIILWKKCIITLWFWQLTYTF